MAKNMATVERRVRLVGGGLLILLGLILTGWAAWVSGLAGAALVVTSAVRY